MHVRLDKVQQSIVKFLSFANLKTSSIPPGLDADGVVELEVPIDLQSNIYDVIILKTEEEILSIPICI